MIRFVDLRGADIGARFSFWDTVLDEFIEVNGSQAWETLNEFQEDCVAVKEQTGNPKWGALAKRCAVLVPGWCR